MFNILFLLGLTTAQNVPTEDRAKHHCEEWFVNQGETTDNIFFKHVASGGQSDVYKCESLSGNFVPDVAAIKMYQRPWEFNVTEREIIDTAMGNVDVGPKVYQFLETGKIEEFLDNMRNFEWIEPPENPEDWGHGGCFECAEEEVANQTAILMARFHYAPHVEMKLNDLPLRYLTQIWPWNTKLVYEHLNQTWYHQAGQDRAVARKLGISPRQMQDEFRWIESIYENDSDLPVTFSHNDVHTGNMMVAQGPYDAETHILIDFDNAQWGYRGFDFNYFFVQLPNFPSDSELETFFQSYRKEANRLCALLGNECEVPTMEGLEHEVRKTRPYGTMKRMLFMKTASFLVFDKDVESYLESLKYFNREVGTPYP